jgi:ATP-GRASP peptide maturase of grasp-with-spasm system
LILILSQSSMEPTTEEVMDWLAVLGARCLRLNGDDLDGGAALAFHLDGPETELGIVADDLRLPLSEVGAVWFRRWLFEARSELVSLLPATASDDKLHYDLRRHLRNESRKLSDFLFAQLAGLPWLSHPRRAGLTKLDVLARAARAGFATPATLVTTEREALRHFCAAHGKVITKAIGEIDIFIDGESSHFLFTAALDLAAVGELPERFAPSLFQEQVDKEYELRVFYLAGECHAMAIFSQGDPQTRTDFRHYNWQRPNRNVPYRLSPETEDRVRRLMDDLDLETGSLDLLQARDGREVFLEVNPIGQFGMVSKPCNYHLEKKVAEHLLRKEADGRRQ